jgi:hypothetical protein
LALASAGPIYFWSMTADERIGLRPCLKAAPPFSERAADARPLAFTEAKRGSVYEDSCTGDR